MCLLNCLTSLHNLCVHLKASFFHSFPPTLTLTPPFLISYLEADTLLHFALIGIISKDKIFIPSWSVEQVETHIRITAFFCK